MKVEYMESVIGDGLELHIAASEVRKATRHPEGVDYAGLMFAVKAYGHEQKCINLMSSRFFEGALQHIKRDGAIKLVTQDDGYNRWCEIYAVADGKIIPVLTSTDGSKFSMNFPNEPKQEKDTPVKKR